MEKELRKYLEGIDFKCGGLQEIKDNVFYGGCGKWVNIADSYRCTDCSAPFHRECARKHFNQIPLEEALKSGSLDKVL